MTKKIILLSIGSLLLSPYSAFDAQQPKKIPRIGIVTGSSSDPSSRIKTFREALQELGYIEGKISYLKLATTRETGIVSLKLSPSS